MDEQEFNARVKELIKEIISLPKDQQDRMQKLAKETKIRNQELKTTVDTVKKSLCDLRICLKYLVFDLEATRRERDELKAIIDNNDTPDKAEGEM